MATRIKKRAALALTLAICLMATACKTEAQIQDERLVSSTQEAANYYDTRSVLNVTGEGKVILEPDTAVVGFTVYAHDADASVAQQLNAELMDAVLAVIRSKGVADDDIETGGIRIHEVYDYEQSPAEIVGYDVYYSVDVTVRNIDVLGAMISEAVAAGATEIDGPTYSIADDTDAYMEALAMAVEAARAKADIMAAGAGVRLSALPLSLDEEGGESHAVYTSNEADMAVAAPPAAEEAEAPAPVDISVPQIEVIARVSAVYQITR